jgi:hypothetical protein
MEQELEIILSAESAGYACFGPRHRLERVHSPGMIANSSHSLYIYTQLPNALFLQRLAMTSGVRSPGRSAGGGVVFAEHF